MDSRSWWLHFIPLRRLRMPRQTQKLLLTVDGNRSLLITFGEICGILLSILYKYLDKDVEDQLNAFLGKLDDIAFCLFLRLELYDFVVQFLVQTLLVVVDFPYRNIDCCEVHTFIKCGFINLLYSYR